MAKVAMTRKTTTEGYDYIMMFGDDNHDDDDHGDYHGDTANE